MASSQITQLLDYLEGFLLGKRKELEYAVTCLLAKGHLLIEDVPGVGKTTLAKSLAHSVRMRFHRVQFTSDLLPSDLIGVTVFHQSRGEFEFQPGPIFTNVLLADEINRANPKTQSALLEAMHDAQISHDGRTTALPSPFFVIATQNHKDHHGTFPLPESQLDRFLMKINLGYPEAGLEKKVIAGNYRQDFQRDVAMDQKTLQQLQTMAQQVHVSEEVVEYIYQLLRATRRHPAISVGVSPRGGQALFKASQAFALVQGRDFVIPDDVRQLAPHVCAHRLILNTSQMSDRLGSSNPEELIQSMLENVAAPV